MKASSQKVDERDVQALIVRGFGKLHHARFLLLRVRDVQQVRRWVREVSSRVTRGTDDASESALQVALAFSTLFALGVPKESLAGFAIEFQEGMTARHRADRLGDTGASDPANWEWGAGERAIDAMLLLYAKTADELHSMVTSEAQRAINGGWDLIATRQQEADGDEPLGLTTHALSDKFGFREHFGFRDGVGQPLVAGLSKADQADQRNPHVQANTIAAGEVVLGYENEYGRYPFSPGVAIDPTGHLAEKSYGRGGFDLGKNSSYLVFRQLEQDVQSFWQFLHSKNNGDAQAAIKTAAKMVGRWPSGAPVVTATERDWPGHERDNDFSFCGFPEDDPHGTKCPLGAHIRRSNPRDSILNPDRDEATRLSNRHRLVRRGRAYGAAVDPEFDLETILEKDFGTAPRGLHFLCLNANIGRQFEFVQHTWCNSTKFARLHDDPDPIIGPGGGQFTIPAEPVRRRVTDLQSWVTTRGGAYLWLPSPTALEYLGALRPLTPLQKHVAFFDRDNDGEIDLRETYNGLRRLGMPLMKSCLLAVIINLMLSFLTDGGFMKVSVRDIHRGLHAFDTGIFDSEGQLNEARFDALFSKALGKTDAASPSDAITEEEMNAFITEKGDEGRPYPGISHWFSQRETELIFCLASDGSREEQGKTVRTISRAMLKDFYRGDLFEKLERLLAYRKLGAFGMRRQ